MDHVVCILASGHPNVERLSLRRLLSEDRNRRGMDVVAAHLAWAQLGLNLYVGGVGQQEA